MLLLTLFLMAFYAPNVSLMGQGGADIVLRRVQLTTLQTRDWLWFTHYNQQTNVGKKILRRSIYCHYTDIQIPVKQIILIIISSPRNIPQSFNLVFNVKHVWAKEIILEPSFTITCQESEKKNDRPSSLRWSFQTTK